MSTLKLAQAVHGARYCHFDEINETVIVWNGSLTFNIYNARTGDCVGMWTSGDNLGLTDKKFADPEWRLQAAEAIITSVTGPEFAEENDGMTYLEAYAG